MLHAFTDLVDRLIWRVLRARSAVESIRDVSFVYMGARDDPKRFSQAQALSTALDQVAAVPEFQALIKRNLASVASAPGKTNSIIPAVGCYATSFEPPLGTNHTYLACRLVWAAKFIEMRRARARGSDHALSRLAHAEMIRFVKGFPDAGQWQEYLRPDDWDF